MIGKRGDVTDGIVIVVTLFFLAVAFIVVGFVNDQFKNVISETDLNSTSVAPDIISKLDNLTSTGIQRAFVLIFSFLILGTLISSFMVRIHPAFLFLYIIFAGLTVFVGAILANAYGDIIDSSALQAVANQQTMTNWIMRNIIKIMIGVIALSMVVLFAKAPESNSI